MVRLAVGAAEVRRVWNAPRDIRHRWKDGRAGERNGTCRGTVHVER